MQTQLADSYKQPGMVDEAIGVWKYLARNRVSKELNDSLALAYNQVGNQEAALALLEGLVNEERSDWRMLTELGELYKWKGDENTAISVWTDLLDRDRGSRSLLDELIEIFNKKGQKTIVAALLMEHVREERLNLGLRHRLTEAYKRTYDFNGAIAFCKNILVRRSRDCG